MTVLHLVRHGQVDNPQKIVYGRQRGWRLSDRGRAEAEAVARHLAGRPLARVYTSPLERAVQTAEPFAAQFGLEVSTDDRLIESANFFEGKRVSVGDGALRDPRNWWALRDPFAPSWGESYRAIADRMYAALLDIREQAEGHEAVCVSHQLPIWTLRRYVERKRLWHDPRKRQCGLASLTSFVFEDSKIVGIEYAEPAAALVAMSPGARTAKGA